MCSSNKILTIVRNIVHEATMFYTTSVKLKTYRQNVAQNSIFCLRASKIY